jgi:hypothetical protein
MVLVDIDLKPFSWENRQFRDIFANQIKKIWPADNSAIRATAKKAKGRYL